LIDFEIATGQQVFFEVHAAYGGVSRNLTTSPDRGPRARTRRHGFSAD
jgi:hypothetical protein